MRGTDEGSGQLFSYVDLEARVRRDHPLRVIRAIANEALGALAADFAGLYSKVGRPSIPPERLLRAMLLQAFYSVRSERQLMERLDTDLLFRWFVGLAIDDPVWDATVFSKNRDRLLDGAIAAKFLAAVLAQPRVKRLISSDHFLRRWHTDRGLGLDEELQAEGRFRGSAAVSSRRNAEADFKGEKRSNETHASTTDPEARLYRKGPGMEAKLAFLGHALMENRCGLIVDACLTPANGHGERIAALAMIEPRADRPKAITLGADKGYDAADFVNELRTMNVRPHIAQNTSGRRSTIDRRTTRHQAYSASQRIRKRIEEAFGWMKTIAGQAEDKVSRRRSRWLGFRLSPRQPTTWSGCRN